MCFAVEKQQVEFLAQLPSLQDPREYWVREFVGDNTKTRHVERAQVTGVRITCQRPKRFFADTSLLTLNYEELNLN